MALDEEEVLQWSQPKLSGSVPSKRYGHSMVQVGPDAYMFGGLARSRPPLPNADLFQVKMKGENFTFNKLEPRGEAPPPRWQHTATVVDRAFVVIGGFLDNLARLNDVWSFDAKTKEWTELAGTSSGRSAAKGGRKKSVVSTTGKVDEDHKAADGPRPSVAVNTNPDAPSPRGAHSSCLIDGQIYVFGGYGGVGYQRRDFNDLYALGTDTWTWQKLGDVAGTPPERRSGHTCTVVKKTMLVYGGWNGAARFNDLHCFDTETMTWSAVESGIFGVPRWHHCGISVVAVPAWQVFVFGGSGGEEDDGQSQGSFLNDAMVLDTGRMKWNPLEIQGDLPPKRSDASLLYDAPGKRLVLFGGWSNKWMADCYTLPVGSIVGPPYAITAISPKIGPVTGGTKIRIEGLGFDPASAPSVRFTLGKKFTEASGKCLSATEIELEAPNVEAMGPGLCDVRISLRGGRPTITYEEFSFFAVTDANESLAYGPGVLPGGAPGVPTFFVIQARNTEGLNSTQGSDEFTAAVKRLPDDEHDEEQGEEEVEGVALKDNDDGSYLVTYTAPREGTYVVEVNFAGTHGGVGGPVRGSPFTVTFEKDADKDNNKMEGPLVMEYIKKKVRDLNSLSKKTIEGLTKEVDPESLDELLTIKTHLHNVTDKAADQKYIIDVVETTLANLKAGGRANARDIDRIAKNLEAGGSVWEEAQKQEPLTKAAIQPLVKVHGAATKKKIEAYEEDMEKFVKKQSKWDFWRFETGHSKATSIMKDARDVMDSETSAMKEMTHIADMFDYASLMDRSKKMMEQVEAEFKEAQKLWRDVADYDAFMTESNNTVWAEVDAEKMEERTKKLHKKMKQGVGKEVRQTPLYRGLDRAIKDFLNTCPLVSALSHPSMRPRHWDAVMKATGKDFVPPHEDKDMKVKALLDLQLHEFQADVEEITDQALKEEKMEQTLERLDETWGAIDFYQAPYQEGSDVMLLRITDDDFDLLEQDQLIVQGMMASRFLATFETEVTGWQRALSMVSEVMILLGDVQRTWSYLEPLFIKSEEVKKELPEDAKRFAGIDVDVKKLLREAGATKNIKAACNKEGVFDILEEIGGRLDQCKKSLAEFLDSKRRIFPRFYFTSEADLLDILSNGSTPTKIIHHVIKVLLATATLELKEGGPGGRPLAVRWISAVGKEDVVFDPPVPLVGKVEIYLMDVLKAQYSTLQKKLTASLQRQPTQSRIDWLMDRGDEGKPGDPSQIMLLLSGSKYVQEVTQTFSRIQDDPDALKQQLDVIKMGLSDLIRLTRTKLDKSDRQRVMCLITMDAHSRDIMEKLIREDVTDVMAFQWQSQLKQVYIDGKAYLKIADGSFDYGYEYLGNGPRLVVTPLTDRIYVTATQALNLKMGCAPAGPAGTGKTETTKDLASALGKCCYVFNCSPEMDYKSMGNIFKGLAASGSWGCFDEFNRLVPEVLSVCSVQFKAVCDGIKADRRRVVIENDEVDLDVTCGVFITMNPGYLGRSELPEGLKTLFRPITVMVPDLVLICENMMMAEGFEEAKVLASKFYGLYSLLAELLSKQLHYDWGLRAVKSVLVVAGGFKRAEPELPEQDLLMRALRDFNTPKIVQQDEVVFFGLMGDLFPGIDPPRKRDLKLEDAVEKACVSRKLDPDDLFMLKVVQLEELLAIRHCVFVMGPPGCGKSNCWRTLAAARTNLGKNLKTKFVDINPKSVGTDELYGFITMATREWRDGLLSKIMRELGQETSQTPKWIVLDGDLDTKWIESMNSVMDDNKMLTLASNERIPLKGHMRMLFEIRDLVYASPATVSRAGILYISASSGNQWRSLIKSWLQRLKEYPTDAPDSVVDALEKIFEKYCAPTLFFLKKECKPIISMEDMTYINTLLRMLTAVYTPELIKAAAADEKNMVKIIETWFVFCGVWAFGSSLTTRDGEDFRKLFSDFWKAEFKSVRIPARETVFDYWLDPESLGFEVWKNSPHFEEIEYDSKVPMQTVTVPTPETASVTYWMDLMINLSFPVLLAGYAGCGKTQLVNGKLGTLDPEQRLSSVINFNFYTDAKALQVTLEAPLEKKTGTNWGPPGKAWMVFFIDDLNLPMVDEYNTQSAIALVRQHMDYGHWYDRAKLVGRNVSNCQYIGSLNPTAGSFEVNPRLQRHFVTFAIGFPGPTSLHTIYNTFLNGHLKHFSEEIHALTGGLVNAALGLHTSVANTFRKSAINFHYEFNIRHMSGVFQGLLVAQPDQFNDPAKVAQLWLHESERVYGDRLVNYDDLNKFKTLAQAAAKKRFPQFNMTNFFAAENADPLVFCHFSESVQDRMYNQVKDMGKLHEILMGALEEYNDMYTTMDLVLFEDAMRHICRIARIILNPSGHALLVGVGGSGKQSLSRLSSFICGYTVSQIVISGTYGINDLKDDLKAMYAKAGLKEEGVAFLFTDSQISNERFLVYLNDLLASGQIPDLYADDEVDEIVNAVTSRVKELGITPDKKPCWDFFINEVKKNLHVILCFSPVGDDFRNRATKFPALVNSTVIDWFQPWPRDALYSVGKKFLADMDVGEAAARQGIEEFMPWSFEIVNAMALRYYESDRRRVYTTPKSFLELLQLYNLLLTKSRDNMTSAIDRLANGLQKLRDTAEAVVEIEADLKIKLADAEEKMRVSEEIATEVAANKTVVEGETEKAEVEAKEVAIIQRDVSAMQKSAEEDLAKAEPAVERAMAALDTLNKKDLSECKTMSTPPKGVDDVFAAVVSLLSGVPGNPVSPNIITQKNGKVKDKDKDWGAAKKALLGNVAEFIVVLKGYKAHVDSNQVPDVNWGPHGVRPYLSLEWFDPDEIVKKNAAAAGLCSWVVNIVTYRDIVVTVEPKRIALREANEKLESANSRLKIVQDKVAKLQATLDKLTKELAEADAAKQAAINEVETGQRRLDLANRLTAALADENVRWAENIEVMSAEKDLLTGDVLLASAFISYIGPFTKKYRRELIYDKWIPFLAKAAAGESIPMSEDSNPVKILTTEAEIAEWNSHSLPDDMVSVENGSIVVNSARWPLMIDPQLQGIAWIRNKEKERNLVVLRLGQHHMLNILERAIDAGAPVLIENMGEKIDAVLQPVIARATTKKGHKRYLKLGDKEVEFHPKFRLYLHTKLSNPHYPPEIQAETALVNFTVTEAGLEDQLLSLVVSKERPDLAEIKSELVQQQNMFKIKIKKLEDDILSRLAAAEGDITSDVELIESLENTKRIANDIADKQIVAQRTEKEISVTSEKYRPVAVRGSLLFFLMNELFRVHTYYVFSLSAFVTVALRAIDLVSGENDPNYKDPEDFDEELGMGMDDDMGSAAGDEDGKGDDGGDGKEGDGKAGEGKAGEGKEGGDAEGDGKGADGEAAGEEGAPEVDMNIKEGLSDEELAVRCGVLAESLTSVSFEYLRRGVFETDKLTIATQLALKILVRDGQLDPEEVQLLIHAPEAADPGAMGPLSEWMPENLWPRVKGLEAVKELNKIGDDMQSESNRWQKWFDEESPEAVPLPGSYSKLAPLHRILVLRAMRRDRVTAALRMFVADSLGEGYVSQQAFDMRSTYEESSPSVPVFFVLFPGVDPTVWVEELGKELGFTLDNGKFMNISMGQGQEAPAQAAMDKYAKEGGWLMLQNVHLMQGWLPLLERQLEVAAVSAHDDFRCYISAEPPPLPYMKNMPESLMQGAIKVANESPADLKSNLRRAWKFFTPDDIDACKKPSWYKACLFTTCFYHAIVQGRRRFGQQGWCKRYAFNQGDLVVCGSILRDNLNRTDVVPWDDLRYIFGEIMYGGHITDAWDRRTNNNYLRIYLDPGILKGASLCKGFVVPDCDKLDFDGIAQHIEDQLPPEVPPIFGLHPNAEIGYLTSTCDSLFRTILSLEGAGGGGGGAGGDTLVRNVINDILERLPENFVMIELELNAEPLLKEAFRSPYVLVALQECTRMNNLLSLIRFSLIELRKGLDGQLNMSEPMEDLKSALGINEVPGRNPFHKTSWEKSAWPSKKGLSSWFGELLRRVEQLERWSSELARPHSMWLPGLFNPMAFLTAIMQVTARQTGEPLDKMVIETEVTAMMKPEEATEYPKTGAYVHGLFIEGSAWALGDDAGDPYDVEGVKCLGYLVDSKLKDLLPALPVLFVRAVVVKPEWEPTSVGYMRHNDKVYDCPVYFTTFRGPTYIFLATLRTEDPVSKWIQAGVAVMMQEDV